MIKRRTLVSFRKLVLVSVLAFAVLVSIVGLGFWVGINTAKAVGPQPGDVIISEFFSNGSSDWVEIQNTTASAIPLSDFKLSDLSTPSTTPTEKLLLDLSGTLPPYGILVFSVEGLNNDGDSVALYNGVIDEDNLYQRVTYGDAVYPVTTGLETAPSNTESAVTTDGVTWTKTSSISKGWFNDAETGVGTAPLLSTIDAAITAEGIETNIGELENPSATPTDEEDALYFEKSGEGKIVFTASLNLTDQATVAVLQTLGEAMAMSEGHIAFDSATAQAMTDTGAKIYMYGLDALGFTAEPTIIVTDDNDVIIDGTGIIDEVSYDPETGELSFTAAHFTQFDVEFPVTNVTTREKFATIQAAINVADVGNTINVVAGTYVEDLIINEEVSLVGVGSVTIDGNHRIEADNVVVDGFTLDLSTSSDGEVGFFLTDVSGVEITNNVFNGPSNQNCNPWKIGGSFGNPIGYNVSNILFEGNTVNKCSIPINLQNNTLDEITINDNIFRDTDGVVYIWTQDGSNPSGLLSNFVFTNNDVDSTNTYGVAFFDTNVGGANPDDTLKDSNFGTGNLVNDNKFVGIPGNYGLKSVSLLANLTSYTLDATNNWWGVANPDISTLTDGEVDATPWCENEACSSARSFNVSINGNTETGFLTIGEAILAADHSDTINVAAGTYNESITIDKTLSLTGVGLTTVIQPAIDQDGIVITADNVLVKDLKVSTSNNGVTPNKAISVEEADNLEINGVTVETIGNKAMGIWVGGSSNSLDPVSGLTIVKSDITVNNEATGIYAAHSAPAHTGWTVGGSAINANSITMASANPLELYDVTNSEVSYNTLTITSPVNVTNVFWTSELSNLSDLVFSNNSVSGSSGSEVAFLTNFVVPGDTSIAGITISGNTFSNWGSRALLIAVPGDVTGTITGVAINANIFQMTTDTEVIGGSATGSATGTGNTFNVSSSAKIQRAIDAVYSGDTINVAAGTYEENLTVNKNLTLVGTSGADETTANGDGDNVFTIGSDVTDLKISGFTITGGGNGIYIEDMEDSTIEISGNTIDGNGQAGIRVDMISGGIVGSTLTITDNTITDNGTDSTGIHIDTVGNAVVTINENSIVENIGDGLFVGDVGEEGGDVDATNNWWGDEAGPAGEGTGGGDEVSTNADFTPWYINSGMTILSDAVDGDTLTAPPGDDDLILSLGNEGEVDLPDGVTDVVLDNDSGLDLSAGIESLDDRDVEIGGETVTMTQKSHLAIRR